MIASSRERGAQPSSRFASAKRGIAGNTSGAQVGSPPMMSSQGDVEAKNAGFHAVAHRSTEAVGGIEPARRRRIIAAAPTQWRFGAPPNTEDFGGSRSTTTTP
jgi:hypothetical protein